MSASEEAQEQMGDLFGILTYSGSQAISIVFPLVMSFVIERRLKKKRNDQGSSSKDEEKVSLIQLLSNGSLREAFVQFLSERFRIEEFVFLSEVSRAFIFTFVVFLSFRKLSFGFFFVHNSFFFSFRAQLNKAKGRDPELWPGQALLIFKKFIEKDSYLQLQIVSDEERGFFFFLFPLFHCFLFLKDQLTSLPLFFFLSNRRASKDS